MKSLKNLKKCDIFTYCNLCLVVCSYFIYYKYILLNVFEVFIMPSPISLVGDCTCVCASNRCANSNNWHQFSAGACTETCSTHGNEERGYASPVQTASTYNPEVATSPSSVTFDLDIA